MESRRAAPPTTDNLRQRIHIQQSKNDARIRDVNVKAGKKCLHLSPIPALGKLKGTSTKKICTIVQL